MFFIKDFGIFVSLHEGMFVDSTSKLRDAVHDVVVSLPINKKIDTNELSKILIKDFNIKVSSKILDIIIFEKWWKKDDYTVFKKEDKSWLDVWPYAKEIERKKKWPSNKFGKGRRKVEKIERENKWRERYQVPTSSHYTKFPNKFDPDDDKYYNYEYGYW